MGETFWEKWRYRFSSAWAVLTGRAYVSHYHDEPWDDDDLPTAADVRGILRADD